MRLMMRRCLPLIPSLILLTQTAAGATANCAAMEDRGPAWFSEQLARAEAAQQRGDSRAADNILVQAQAGLPRRVDVSLDGRCVGPELWQRFYRQRQVTTRALGQQAEKSGSEAGGETNLRNAMDWYVRGDSRDDARRVMRQLTTTPQGTGWAINRLRSEIGSLDTALKSGFQLLPDEQSGRAFWQTGLDGLVAHARRQAADVLAREERILSRDATDKELQLEGAQESQREMVSDFFGDKSLAVQNEAQRDVNRAGASLRLLGQARDWLQPVSPADAAPVPKRAVARGDALMARAGDSSLGLEARDALYESADGYFEFAGNRERHRAAEQARAAIAPALAAERKDREARLQTKKAEFKDSAREMQESMQKTDKEKQSFKDEADAMEAELGL